MRELAETLTPSVMELSGADAVFVLEGADIARAVEAITFGLRINGSATCMAPRRIFVTEAVADHLTSALVTALDQLDPVPVPESTRALLRELVDEATLYGAKVLLDGLDVAPKDASTVYTTLLADVTPEMRIAQTDIFAPVLSILRVANNEAAIAAHSACPYALTASIFGPPGQAERLATRLRAGTVLINDIIVPTADPRASFSGRGRSGFGATRGREGLLAMTAPKSILRQRSRSRRAYQPNTAAHIPFFASFAQALHAGSLRARFAGLKALMQAAKKIK
jgi:aldehyde dehydrogenase (NAD+)